MAHAFPGYTFVDRLYTSRRSIVDRAICRADGQMVVIKQSTDEVLAIEAARRAQHEYSLLHVVRGDGIIDVREIARDGIHVALVVDNFGESLAKWIAARRLALGEILDIGVAVARALARIHAAGVVHRDINPQNLVYDPTSRTTKLIDFDVASGTRSVSLDFVAPTGVEGTLGYMSPEQTGRLNRSVDARSDLYSLGITLFELSTGHRPFDGDALAIVHGHLAQQPPRIDEIDPAIPSVVADIVSKLVAKAPEQRYQTASGLHADLERCRQALAGSATIASFAIGQHDVSSRFEFSERLYGREAEVRALVDAFARTAMGGVETVLVSGYSGIGKSSVVREIYAPVTLHRGYVASGKFDQLHRDVPYSAVVAALDELVAQIVADPELDAWRIEIAAAVAGDAPLVRSVLPAIEAILGPQPAEPVVEPEIAQLRLAVALSRMIQVFARKRHPLVLFLDDMQWADSASLQLLTRLATSADTESLLLIEAFRDNEVDVGHPFALALRAHEARGAKVSRIALAPLGLVETTELVADALRLSPERAGEAASVIWRKTEGNPFFIRQFTRTLHDEGYITFDPIARSFVFEVAAIERVAITDNVADLLARNLGKLPAATRDVLVTAAAIGNRFDVAMLAIVAGRSVAAVHDSLAPAVDAGMIVPIAKLAWIDRELVGCPRYGFQHDRIQQAAYEASPVDVRELLHLEIGRQIIVSSTPSEIDLRLFDIVHHLNLGRASIVEEWERSRFVKLVLEAARRARRSGAFDVAVTLLRAACASRDSVAHYAVWFESHRELAEVLSLSGLPAQAREVAQATIAHVTTRDLATLYAVETSICVSLGLMADAVACTRRAAAILGVELPTDPDELRRQTEAEIAMIMTEVTRTPIERWIELPSMADPDKLAAMDLLTKCLPAAYQIEPSLLGLISVKLVTLSLRHGNCIASAEGYTSFAILAWTTGQVDVGYRFGRLGVDLAQLLGGRSAEAAFSFATFTSPWRRPLVESIERLRTLVPRALELGQTAIAVYAGVLGIAYHEIQGAPFPGLLDEVRRCRMLAVRFGLPELDSWLSWYSWHLRSWTGAPLASGEAELDAAAVELALASGSRSMLTMFRILQLEQLFWRGDFAGVIERSHAITEALGTIPANVYNAELRFYYCLAAIAVGETGGECERYRADLARYADLCPANYAHMSSLVEAELARVRGDVGMAMTLYDATIDLAAETGFLKVETIAHELAARFWIEHHKPAFAAVHLGKARDLCEHWGARPRAYELERRRRGLSAPAGVHAAIHSATAVMTSLDFATVVKASHAIASDIVLDSLLVKIMEIIVENTGAQTGAIILESNGELAVHASKHDGPAVSVSGGVALADARGVSESIIKYAMRTSECVVLGNATRHPTFRTDPYVRDRRPRSVLCLPIVHKERMIGAVYLENNLVDDAFTVERLEALGILVAQLAISIENAMMFSRLEDLVAVRTRALTRANEQLREQALAREGIESQLRLAQKLHSVGQLAAGIAHEINTPIQFVGDSVLFLQDGLDALLGLVDTYRASIDVATGTVDVDVIRKADESYDVEYLRENLPPACSRALEGVRRVSKIVCAMTVFSHPDRQEQTPTNLNSTLENTLVMARNEYGHVADVECDFGDLPDVSCHAGEISQVFLNLVINAAHAIEDRGDPARRGMISITTRREDEMVVIAIRDTGSGIPDAIRDRIFDPFFTTKEVGRGTGQGLALARAAIVDRHDGRLELTTSLGIGTTFFVRLPIQGHAGRVRGPTREPVDKTRPPSPGSVPVPVVA